MFLAPQDYWMNPWKVKFSSVWNWVRCSAGLTDFGEAAISPHLFPAGTLPLIILSIQRRLRLSQQTTVAVQTTIMGSPLLSGINYHCAPLTSKPIALGCTRCTSAAVASHKNTHKRGYPWVLSWGLHSLLSVPTLFRHWAQRHLLIPDTVGFLSFYKDEIHADC